MRQKLLPQRLRRGAHVGIVSPSWGGASRFPHRLERGIAQLKALGFQVRIGRHALNERGFVSDTEENRVHDLHEMFLDPDVAMILSAIGGDHSCHLLPLLNFELIQAHPKIFMGYSDTTVLAVAIWQRTGVVTFYGPALLTDFAEYPDMFDYTRQSLLDTLTEPAPRVIGPSARWTDEYLDWYQKQDLERPRQMVDTGSWSWLRPGRAEGVLIGGCLESLQHLRGTGFWPDWTGAILFFETSNEKPDGVDAILMDYENMGVLPGLRGLLVGRSWGYSLEERRQLHDVLIERTRRFGFPVVADMDFGHTAPQCTLPIGCEARIDSTTETFEIREPAVL